MVLSHWMAVVVDVTKQDIEKLLLILLKFPFGGEMKRALLGSYLMISIKCGQVMTGCERSRVHAPDEPPRHFGAVDRIGIVYQD